MPWAVAEYMPVVESISKVLEEDPEPLRPLLVRMAWHSMAQYNAALRPVGGSTGGCMRPGGPELDLRDNKGLEIVGMVLEKVKKAHPFITYADLYQLAGNVALEYMGSPTLHFRPGRRDFSEAEMAEKCVKEHDRLPIKHFGHDAFPHRSTLRYFLDKFAELGISLNTDRAALWKAVSLMGGHNMGAMHKEISGNQGNWTRNNNVFGNEFFVNLAHWRWGPWTAESGETDLQYRGGPGGQFVMLPIDLVMRHDRRMRYIVHRFAWDKDLYARCFAAAWRQIQENGM